MNQTVEMIKNRASIRKFTDELLTREERQALVDAALSAPSGANLQNWHFSFVEDKKDGGSLVDAGVAIENIVLAAESMGLGSCILGGCRDAFNLERGDYFKKLVQFPEGYEFAVGAAIGHPAMEATPHERLEEKVTFI